MPGERPILLSDDSLGGLGSKQMKKSNESSLESPSSTTQLKSRISELSCSALTMNWSDRESVIERFSDLLNSPFPKTRRCAIEFL